MAYVGISNRLRVDVERTITSMGATEMTEFKSPADPVLTGTEDWLTPKMWGVLAGTPYEGDLELTVMKPRTVNFSIQCGDEPAIEVSVHVPRVPKHLTVGEYYTSTPEIEVTPEDHPYFQQYVDFIRNRQEIDLRWKKVRLQVVNFLRDCKSLNEGLKLWPDLRRYVDQSYLDLVDKKTERAAPTKEPSPAMKRLAEMDLEAITTSTVLARMAGAAAGNTV